MGQEKPPSKENLAAAQYEMEYTNDKIRLKRNSRLEAGGRGAAVYGAGQPDQGQTQPAERKTEPASSRSGWREIDVTEVFWYLLKHVWFIILATAVGVAGMTYYTINYIPDTYTASAKLYVYTNNPNQTNYQYTSSSDLYTATRLVQTYGVIIKTNKVMEAVANRLGGGIRPETLAAMIRFESVNETEIIGIKATTSDPKLSMDICNAVAEFAPAELTRITQAGNVDVVDYAKLPVAPDSKGVSQRAMTGGTAGFAIACVLLFLLMLRDRHIRGEGDLVNAFSQEIIASIPAPRNHKGKSITISKGKPGGSGKVKRTKGGRRSKAGVSRANRYILTSDSSPDDLENFKLFRISLQVILENRNVVMITSSIPSEGKSSVSANLAIVTAMDGRKVLVIDADMRKPMQHVLFQTPASEYGLTEVLTGRTSFDRAVHRNVHPNLDVLTVGAKPQKPIELLNSISMRNLLLRARNEYDFVIVDTPPINVVADALVLADQVDGVAFVVRKDVSTRDDIRMAMHIARRTKINILGFVLTNAKRTLRARRHKYYYSYKNYGVKYSE